MDDQKYVTRLMRARCSKGTMENYLNVDIDHGIIVGADAQPLMNANDHVSGRHVIHFGCCESDQNPERMFRKALVGGFLGGFLADALEDVGIMTCKCKPNTPNPWEFVNEDSIVEGAPALMVCSTLTCRYGGVIEIIDPDGDGDIIIEEENPDNPPEVNIEEIIQQWLSSPDFDAEVEAAFSPYINANGLVDEAVEQSFVLGEDPKITYSYKFESNSPASIADIKFAIKHQLNTLSSSASTTISLGSWSFGGDGSVGWASGLAPSFSLSKTGADVGVKVGQDIALDKNTTLKAPVIGFSMFGMGPDANALPSASIKYGIETKTDNYDLDSTLKIEKKPDTPQLQLELAPAQNRVSQPSAASSVSWLEKGWNWVTSTASEIGSEINDWWNDGGKEATLTGLAIAGGVVLVAGAIVCAPAVIATVGPVVTSAATAAGAAITSAATAAGTAIVAGAAAAGATITAAANVAVQELGFWMGTASVQTAIQSCRW